MKMLPFRSMLTALQRRALLPLLAVAFSLLPGCGPSNIRIADEPTFSKLAGRWSTSLFGLVNKYRKEEGLEAEIKPWRIDDRIVFVTIRPDGRIDWSRSYAGLGYGLCDLAEVGDRCAVGSEDVGPFKVIAAEYSPKRTSITIDGFAQNDTQQESRKQGTLSVELNSDGSATLRATGGFQHLVGTQGVFDTRLERHCRHRRVVKNKSSIAGRWVGRPHDDRALLVIRKDGTFDWTGTIYGNLGCWHQLEFPGDQSTCAMDWRVQNKLISAEYEPNESAMTVRTSGAAYLTYAEYELHVERIDERQISITFKARVKGGESVVTSYTLRRNDQAAMRGDLPMGTDY